MPSTKFRRFGLAACKGPVIANGQKKPDHDAREPKAGILIQPGADLFDKLGGDRLFASMDAACDALCPAMQERFCTLTAVYDSSRVFAATLPEQQCRCRQAPHPIAVWDSRASQHYAASDYFPQLRGMERVTITGDRPYFDAGR